LSAITLDHTNEGVIVSKNFNKRQSYKRVEEIPRDAYLSDCEHNLKGLEILDAYRVPKEVLA